jgi:hypothetical protein
MWTGWSRGSFGMHFAGIIQQVFGGDGDETLVYQVTFV